MRLNEQEQSPEPHYEPLALPDFSCTDFFDDRELDCIDSMFQTSVWDSDYENDIDPVPLSEEMAVSEMQPSSHTNSGTVPSGSEIFQSFGINPSLFDDSCGAYSATVHESNALYHGFNLCQHHQQHASCQTADLAPEGLVSPQQQQNVLVNIQQLKRLTESMRRSAISRHQVLLQRQAMAAAQKKQDEKQVDAESLHNMSNWLNGRISQSKRQLRAYANTMSYFDIVHG